MLWLNNVNMRDYLKSVFKIIVRQRLEHVGILMIMKLLLEISYKRGEPKKNKYVIDNNVVLCHNGEIGL